MNKYLAVMQSTKFILVSLLLCWAVSAQATVSLYLSPNGKDSNNGKSETNPLKTLRQVWKLIQSGSDNEDYLVNVLPGEYIGQSTRIKLSGHSPRVVITGVRTSNGDYPVFRGKGTLESWLVVNAVDGVATNLTIENLTVQDYFTAIILTGTKYEDGAYNTGTVIQNNVFRNIGSIASKKDHMSTAAIALINSRNNRILGNKFYNIRNKSECPHLHALYIAHEASNNVIDNNLFDGACGAPIRLRDRSNQNKITNNRFVRIEDSPAVQEWYCDKGARRGCSEIKGECPSINNALKGNRIEGDFPLTTLKEKSPRRPWCADKEFDTKRYMISS